MKLIVGLGNVGDRYAKTRHNAGFMVIDALIKGADLPACTLNAKFKAELVEANLAGEKLLLVKPQTMMNLSGNTVGELMRFYKLEPSDVWVIYDDVDLEFGKLRIRQGGSSGGHNGVKSIMSAIGEEFIRFRAGVKNADLANRDTADFVLERFNKDEEEALPQIVTGTANHVTHYLEHPVEDTTYTLI